MNNEQALRLAAACVEAIKTLGGAASALSVFNMLEKQESLYRDVPVTMATVSKSLRSLVRTRRAFIVNDSHGIKYSTTPFLRVTQKNALKLLEKEK